MNDRTIWTNSGYRIKAERHIIILFPLKQIQQYIIIFI